MDYSSGVQMLDTAKHLVEKIRHAFVIEIHLDNLAQIGVHQLHDQIYILKLVQRALWSERIQKTDYL